MLLPRDAMQLLSRRWLLLLTFPLIACEPGASPLELGARTEASDAPRTGIPTIDWQDPIENPPKKVSGEWPPLQQSVPLYSMDISPEDLQALEDNITFHDYAVPGVLRVEGRSWNVRVSYRGNHTRYLPKRQFQIKFDDEDPFLGGVKQLELLAEWKDGGLLTQKMWFDLLAAAGVRASKAKYVQLEVNGSFHGVMVEIEAVKKAFLSAHGFDRNSDIYRCGQRDCELRDGPRDAHQKPWVKRTNEDEPWDYLWEMIAGVNRTAPEDLAVWLDGKFELEQFLVWLAVDAAIANYSPEDSRSFFIFDRETRKWSFVPWDLNNSLALYNRTNGLNQGTQADRPLKCFSAYDPLPYVRYEAERAGKPELKPTWSTLVTRIHDEPLLRARLRSRIQKLLETRFRLEELGPRIDHYAELLKPLLERDPWVDQAFPPKSAAFLKQFVEDRRTWLIDHLEQLDSHGRTALKIDRVGLDASGEALIQIHNGGKTEKDLGGMYLTGFIRTPKQALLPAIRIPPGESVELRAATLTGFQLDPAKPEVALFAADGETATDLVFLPALTPGVGHGRSPSGSENFAPMSMD